MENIRENKAELQSAIQKIGNMLAQSIPYQWEKVVYGFFVSGEEGFTHQHIWCMMDGEDDYVNLMEDLWEDDDFLDAMEDTEKCTANLHKLCADAHDDWSEMTMILYSTGTFSLDFKYEKIPSLSSMYIADWQSRFFD